MIEAFFRRWLMVRAIYRFIFVEDTIISFDGRSSSRVDRISAGISEENFVSWLRWKWEGINEDETFAERISRPDTWWEKFYFNLPWRKRKRETFRVWARQTLRECTSLGYIEDAGGVIKMKSRGMEIRVWYFPVVAFFQLHFIRVAVTRIIDWGIPALVIFLLAKYLHITLSITP